jgi:two-component system, cell cycle sensor histidine kinase and response regulator CckA
MTASKILIVEDELLLADDIAQLLKGLGHEVVSIVSSGEEAIKKADETCPDLVIMDIVLSGQIDGIEAAGCIKSQVETGIVYLTAHSKKDLFERAKLTEPFAYLSKPVSPEELEGTVEMALYKHKMEKRLRENEEKFRAVFENSFDAMILTEIDGKILEANSAALRMLTRTKEEIIREGVASFVDMSDSRLNAVRTELDKKGRFIGELYFKRKNGAPFPVEVSSVVFLDSKGDKKVCNITRDITQRKQAEEALLESQEKYRLVVENTREAIAVAQEGLTKFTNSRVEELIGYPHEALRHRPFLEFIHPEDRDKLEQRSRRQPSGAAPCSSCFRVIHKDGSTKWVEHSAVPVNWEGLPATLNFMNDITEKRKVEEELVKLDKLQSVGLLAGGIAHDFNNILTAILGNISLAKVSAISGDRVTERLSLAEESCLQAQNLTQQLLTFSSGGAPVTTVSDVSKIVREGCIEALWDCNANCTFDFSDDFWTAEVDGGQISQVFGNLTLNAIQAMSGGGLIRVTGRNVVLRENGSPLLPSGRYLKISLEDHGSGISSDHITRVFDPYFTTKNKGSGLGLATAHAIIQRHGGIITVASQVNIGTTFHVYLPASEKDIQTETNSEDSPAFGTGRVLLMDDELPIRRLAEDLLSFLGYQVAVAEHGEEAIKLFTESKECGNPFDIVILDLTIVGGMGGIDAIKALRQIDPGIKAIVSSGYSSDPVMGEYGKYQFDGVVAKPYTVSELSRVIKKVIER